MTKRLLKQQRHDKNTLYSIHEPKVKCIAKGKSPMSLVKKPLFFTTSTGNGVIDAQSLTDNPYDGYTLSGPLKQVKALTGNKTT